HHGTQESRRKFTQRARFQRQAPRRQDLRRRERERRPDPDPPARHGRAPRRQRRRRARPHAVCASRRQGRILGQGRGQQENREHPSELAAEPTPRKAPPESVGLFLFRGRKSKPMKFIDEAKIQVHAGKGGDGSAAFRREKFVPRGGPSGGDGGRGGSVWAVAERNINTLVDYRFARIHRAQDGDIGRGGEDIVLRMPVGTLVKDEDGTLIADLATHGQRALLAKGGQGGLGNLHFKSSINRAPRQFTRGEAGESRELSLELRVLADVGLLG